MSELHENLQFERPTHNLQDLRDKLSNYVTKPEYPHDPYAIVCIEEGISVADNGGLDFWGDLIHPLKDPDIGVHAYTHLIRGDYDIDDDVDINDMGILGANWLILDSPCNIGGDSNTDIADLIIFVDNWLIGAD